MGVSAKGLAVGDTRELLLVDDLKRTQMVMYAGASGDYNPLHTDDTFTKEMTPYPGVFAHGMLSMGYVGEFLHRAAGGVANVRKFRARFAKLTWPGDVVSCKGTVTAVRREDGRTIVDCDVWTETQAGERKVVGSATLALPAA